MAARRKASQRKQRGIRGGSAYTTIDPNFFTPVTVGEGYIAVLVPGTNEEVVIKFAEGTGPRGMIRK